MNQPAGGDLVEIKVRWWGSGQHPSWSTFMKITGWMNLKVSKRFRCFCYLPQHTREIDNLNILPLICQSSSESLSVGIDVLGLRISAYDRQVYRRVKSWHGNRCLRHCGLHGVSKLSLRPCMSWTSKDAGNHGKIPKRDVPFRYIKPDIQTIAIGQAIT